MTTEMIRLEKLYAKGELIWKDANEWNSEVVEEYKSTSITSIFVVEKNGYTYVFNYTSGKLSVYEHDAYTGELIRSLELFSCMGARSSFEESAGKVYISYAVSGLNASIAIFDLLTFQIELLEESVGNLGSYSELSKNLTVDNDGHLYIFLSEELRKYDVSKNSLELIWSISGNTIVSLENDNDFIYARVLRSEGSGVSKYDCKDGTLIVTSNDASSHTSGDYLGRMFLEDGLIYHVGLANAGGIDRYGVYDFTVRDANTLGMNTTRLMMGEFSKNYIGFMSGNKFYAVVNFHQNVMNSSSRYRVPGIAKIRFDILDMGIEELLNLKQAIFPNVSENPQNYYRAMGKGSNDHIYYLAQDGILRKRKLAKRGVLFNGNID